MKKLKYKCPKCKKEADQIIEINTVFTCSHCNHAVKSSNPIEKMRNKLVNDSITDAQNELIKTVKKINKSINFKL